MFASFACPPRYLEKTMQQHVTDHDQTGAESRWLRGYYLTRAVVSAGWVSLAFTIGKHAPDIAGALLIAYPVWDALANWADAAKSGGLRQNRSQALNVIVSALTAIAVAIALNIAGMGAVFSVFGVWAILSGAFQLETGLRRWKSFGAQWVMVLSGAQSALAGIFFVKLGSGPVAPDISAIAGYAGVGAFYFLLSAAWLTFAGYRRRAD